MRQEIIVELNKLEIQLDIIILYAVESGSRAWGFASTNSDWDVRFIYVHKRKWYLSIDEQKDSYNKILPNEIDLSGWELKKTLKLFRKSNPPFMEWLDSPIIYKENYSTIKKLREVRFEFFNPKGCMYHYLSMAVSNFREYLQGDLVRIKKYFYVLRPILACSWIKRTNTMAPMEFEVLLNNEIQDASIFQQIETLLDRKKAGEELDLEPRIEILNDFLKQKIEYFQTFMKDFDIRIQPDTEKLNQIFIDTLDEIENNS